MLGVLGGMGPLATVDFLTKLIKITEGETDQRHIPTITWSVPQIPDRSNHIVNGGENPYPELHKGIINLQSMGATVIVIPCNTAHFWYDDLTLNTRVTILHIVDAVIDQLTASLIKETEEEEHNLAPSEPKRVGLLATTGTVRSGIYQKKLDASGWEAILPSQESQRLIMHGISLAKADNVKQARLTFLQQIKTLKSQGARQIILGCTELPAVLEASGELIDSNLALADRCVRWFNASYNGIYCSQIPSLPLLEANQSKANIIAETGRDYR